MVFLAALGTGANTSPVAVKVPSRPGALDAEAEALQQFAHTHVVRLLDGPRENGALVLELCDQGTLADRLQKETLTPDETGELLAALVAALRSIHGHGWIHGDISPANIGLRSDEGPALLDFATARPADGVLVAEGTAEFAGPLRQADPRLDIRALAATALLGLGEPDRWDHRKRQTQEGLVALIDRCDDGTDVGLADLEDIAASASTTAPRTPRVGSSRGGPAVNPPTRAFGPPPMGGGSVDHVDQRASWQLALLVGAICLIALAIEFRPSANTTAGDPARLVAEIPASATLSAADASWDSTTGVVTIEHDGERQDFAAGEQGDLAAIGDWTCNGVETLGLFRPATEAWYVFSSWADGAVADISPIDVGWHHLDTPLVASGETHTLAVATHATGCDGPVVRAISASDG